MKIYFVQLKKEITNVYRKHLPHYEAQIVGKQVGMHLIEILHLLCALK